MKQNIQDTTENTVSSGKTDIIGDFHLASLVGCGLAKHTSSDGMISVDNPTEANYILLEFELPSGDRVVARPCTQFVLYNNQGQVLSELFKQGFGYVNTNDSVAFTSTEEKANLVHNEIIEYTSHPVGITYISNMILSEFVEALRLYFGNKNYATHDMRSEDVVNCRTRNDHTDLGIDESVVDYIELVEILSGDLTRCLVSEVDNKSSFSVCVGTKDYEIKLSCESVLDCNPLEKIVDQRDFSSVYEVEGENILLGSAKFARKKTSYEVLGENRAESLSIALEV